MREGNTFERDYRDKLNSLDSARPESDLSWDQMAPDIFSGMAAIRKKRRKRFFFWIFFISLLALGSSIFVYHRLPESETPPITRSLSLSREIKGNSPDEKALTPNQTTEEQKILDPSGEKNDALPFAQIKKATNIISKAKADPANIGYDDSQFVLSLKNDLPLDSIFRPVLLISNASIPDSVSLVPLPIMQEKEDQKNWGFMILGGFNAFTPNYRAVSGAYEEELNGWHAGIRLSRKLSKNLSIHSGLEYERLRYRFDWFNLDSVQLFRPNTVDTVFINVFTNDSTFIYTDSVAGTRRTLIRNYNSHYSLNLPLLLGYRFDLGKVSLGLNGGLNLRFLQESTGFTAFDTLQFVNISEQEVYRKGLIPGLQGEVQINYNLFPNWSLSGMFRINQSLNDWFRQEEFNYEKRPAIYTFSIGLIRKF